MIIVKGKQANPGSPPHLPHYHHHHHPKHLPHHHHPHLAHHHHHQGIEANLNLVDKHYPGWVVRVYYDLTPGNFWHYFYLILILIITLIIITRLRWVCGVFMWFERVHLEVFLMSH